MEKETRRSRKKEKRPSGLMNWLRWEGRRCCAVALCVSMIAGNCASLAWAGEESISGSFLFRLDRASLYDALQEAVMEGDIVDKEFEFQGEVAEEYDLLLNETEGHDGELYELKPEIAHNDGNLGLRIFARLDGEIPLGDEEETIEYEITGSEEFIFLLTNRSHKEYQAVIQVDDKRSEVITVVPKSSLQAGLEDSAYTSASDFGPGETGEAEGVTGTGTTTMPGSGSSGGSGGGGGGGSSNKGSYPQEGAEDTANRPEADNGSQGGNQEEGKTEGSEDKDNNSGSAEEGGASDSGEDKGGDQNSSEQGGSGNQDSADKDSGSNDSDSNASDKSDSADSGDGSHDSGNGSGSSSESGKGEASGSGSDSGDTSGSGSSSNEGSSNEGGSGSSSGSEGGSSGSSSGSDSSSGNDSSSSDGSDSGSSSGGSGSSDGGSSSSGSGSDSGSSSGGSSSSGDGGSSSDSGSSSGGGEAVASISRHGVSLVAMSLDEIVASPSDAEADEETEAIEKTEETGTAAEDSVAEEATPSNADEEVLDGRIYEAVLLGEDAAVAFVTTATEMLLDEEDYRTATPSNAYPAKIREFKADGVVVVVEAEDGVLPEDAELTVTELVKGDADTTEQYEEAERALEEAGTEYAGMMAFDISFWLDGEEIEPDGPVQVSMRVDSEKLPREADLESLVVQHLADVNGDINVESVADCGDETAGTIEVNEAEVLAADFEVESFSTFVITWNANALRTAILEIKAECVEESGGKYIPVKEDGESSKVDLLWETWTEENGTELDFFNENQSEQINIINGYRFQGVLYQDKYITRIKIQMDLDEGTATLYYYNNSEEVYRESCGLDSILNEKKKLSVKFVYVKDISSNNVEIIDTIPQNGCLTASLATDMNGRTIIYKWFKSIKKDFNTAKKVEKRLVTGNSYNLSENGSSVNVALDMGAEHYYWVQMFEKMEGDETEQLIGTSTAYYVDYNSELKNGGFEEPPVGNTYNHCLVGTEGLEWQTTESSQTVEVVSMYSTDHNLYHKATTNKGVAEGTQCGEINSHSDGALYQDVLTIPGSTLYWQLYHRARGYSGNDPDTKNTDTMYVVIMATKDAEMLFQINEGEDVAEKIRFFIANGECPGSIWELKDNGEQWWFHNDAYTVAEGQYLTRFFFISGDKGQLASKNVSQGNLLDDVSFSTELKPPSKEKGHLSITKVVEGLSQNEINDYKIKLSIKNAEGQLVESNPIELSNFVKTSDTTYSATCVIANLDIGEYQISEEVVTSGGLTSSLGANYTFETPKVKKDGETEFSSLKLGDSVNVSMEVQKTSSIQIVNTYKRKASPPSLTIGKEVKNGNANETFKFRYIVLNGDGEISTREYESIKVYEGENAISSDNNQNHEFTLKHGQKKRIEGIPSGYKVIVTEIGSEDYDTLITHKEGNPIEPGENASKSPNNAAIVGKSFELDITDNTEVLFTNSKKVVTPTGVHTNGFPHLLMLAIAALGMAGMAATGTTVKARKKNDEQ